MWSVWLVFCDCVKRRYFILHKTILFCSCPSESFPLLSVLSQIVCLLVYTYTESKKRSHYMLWKSTFYLINQHIHHLTYLAVCLLVKTFKFYFLSTCQLYNTVLSIIVTIFYMRSSNCISLIAGKFHHLLTSPYFLHTLAPDNHFSTLFLSSTSFIL